MKTFGIYIHIPFCSYKCIYCDFYSLTNSEYLIDDFVNNLCTEIDITCKSNDSKPRISTIFIGGGTPSLLSAIHLEKIINNLIKNFSTDDLREFSIEANPGELSYEKMKDFKSIGINRLSLGVQSFNKKTLKQLSRWHNENECVKSFNHARQAGFSNINIDLIFGVPGQTISSWHEDLKKVIELNPEHISAYSLTVEKKTKLHNLVKTKKVIMPDEKLDIEMFKEAIQILTSAKYLHYEVSNYSKPKKQCLHNIRYWERKPYFAFGPSSHGYRNLKRYWNISNLGKYIKSLESKKLPIENTETLTKENVFHEIIINGLRMTKGINVEFIQKNYNNVTIENLRNKISKFSNYFIETKTRLKLTNEGTMIADELSLELMSCFSG